MCASEEILVCPGTYVTGCHKDSGDVNGINNGSADTAGINTDSADVTGIRKDSAGGIGISTDSTDVTGAKKDSGHVTVSNRMRTG